MTRIVLLALAALSFAAAVRPAMADTAQRDTPKPVIVRMSEVLTAHMGAKLAEEAAAASAEADVKSTQK